MENETDFVGGSGSEYRILSGMSKMENGSGVVWGNERGILTWNGRDVC